MYTIDEIKQRLRYAENFTPHKIGYYQDLLAEAEQNLLKEWEQKEAENKAKARSKKNFFNHQ